MGEFHGKFFVFDVNRKRRLEFAKTYVSKNVASWEQIIFSDKRKFNAAVPSHHLWPKKKTKMVSKNLQAAVKLEGGGVVIWGCMRATGVGKLTPTGIMNQHVYINNLKK